LTGIDVPPDIAPSMIDEFPILFVAAAMAQGVTRTSGLEELRVKESDRLALMAQGLARLGVVVEEREDGLRIEGSGGAPLSGGNAPPLIAASLDHRIAMSFAVAGLASRSGLTVDDMRPVATSFPGFTGLFRTLGAMP
jgi:3-phosphoshikimate 1-carboxyvinyltransferase